MAMLTSASACGPAPQNVHDNSSKMAEVEALIDRCGLRGHIVYELAGNELRLFGFDPRFERQVAGCFSTALLPLGLGLGWVEPQDRRFMGPPEARPSETMLEEIERRLARGSCARDLNRWWREYGFRWEDGRLNLRILYIALHETQPGEPNRGRIVYDNADWFIQSDGPGGFAGGTYDTATRRLTLDHCGPNFELGRPIIVP